MPDGRFEIYLNLKKVLRGEANASENITRENVPHTHRLYPIGLYTGFFKLKTIKK